MSRKARSPSRRRHRVVALAYDGLCTFEFGCVVELFALDRPELGVDWYDFSVCAAERGPLRAAGGIEVRVPNSLALLDQADTIVIPGWRNADEVPPAALLRRIRTAYERGARLCTICSGVFVLAAAGILDGRTVTTHWRYAERLSKRYPGVTVEPNSLYIDSGQVLTSAGSAAGLDMLLHLVRTDYGARIANQVAQRLVIPPHREGGQAQYLPRPMPQDERNRLSKLIDWVRAHPAQSHTLRTLARRASMSPRTLQRQFQETVGFGPYEWLIRERVALAKDLLQAGRHSLPHVADAVGFNSQETFRRHFRRVAGTSPATYRRQFASS
ncbi:transcriptional regulator FtrA [Steroidobacter sp.]|uniref:transcriptional regulator FtrA n=1 Tax=Steroidobacter sp. TaxID=1978227 RepID=UPI001A5443FB|nr:transcriptional regulator FtrA [Steroidobacter sp.]MBL8267599.1 transcriptional regulator FtrA [Steroidobacter sp.]